MRLSQQSKDMVTLFSIRREAPELYTRIAQQVNMETQGELAELAELGFSLSKSLKRIGSSISSAVKKVGDAVSSAVKNVTNVKGVVTKIKGFLSHPTSTISAASNKAIHQAINTDWIKEHEKELIGAAIAAAVVTGVVFAAPSLSGSVSQGLTKIGTVIKGAAGSFVVKAIAKMKNAAGIPEDVPILAPLGSGITSADSLAAIASKQVKKFLSVNNAPNPRDPATQKAMINAIKSQLPATLSDDEKNLLAQQAMLDALGLRGQDSGAAKALPLIAAAGAAFMMLN